MIPRRPRIRRALFAKRRVGQESVVSPLTPILLGRPATSFAESAARDAAVFRGVS